MQKMSLCVGTIGSSSSCVQYSSRLKNCWRRSYCRQYHRSTSFSETDVFPSTSFLIEMASNSASFRHFSFASRAEVKHIVMNKNVSRKMSSFRGNKRNFYDVLGVSHNAEQDEIKRAYFSLSKKFHPDITGGSDEKWKEMVEAYETLRDPQKRQEYDLYIRFNHPSQQWRQDQQPLWNDSLFWDRLREDLRRNRDHELHKQKQAYYEERHRRKGQFFEDMLRWKQQRDQDSFSPAPGSEIWPGGVDRRRIFRSDPLPPGLMQMSREEKQRVMKEQMEKLMKLPPSE